MKIQTHKFDNGFSLIHEKNENPITAIFVYIRFGSIHETQPQQKGIAHFIEHMCFKGTKKKPSAIDIAQTYDEIGAYINAETAKQYTCYKVKCIDKYATQSIQVLADMIFHSIFKKKDMDLERNVVIEENITHAELPKTHLEEAIYATLYKGTPYSSPIDTIKYHLSDNSLKPVEILRMYRQFYQPHNMGMSIVSNLSFDSIKRAIHQSPFMTQPRCSPQNTVIEYPLIPTYNDEWCKTIVKKGIYATHISIAFRTCPYTNPDMYPLFLLKNILGGYMSSRIFTLLREKYGLTYNSHCSTKHHLSSGHFEIYTMCNANSMLKHKDHPGVLHLLIQVLNDIVKKGITQKELNEVKGKIQGHLVLNMEHTETKCVHNGVEYILYDNRTVVPYKDLYKKHYEHITKKDIHEIIRKYFRPENMFVCFVGENVPKISIIKSYFTGFHSDD